MKVVDRLVGLLDSHSLSRLRVLTDIVLSNAEEFVDPELYLLHTLEMINPVVLAAVVKDIYGTDYTLPYINILINEEIKTRYRGTGFIPIHIANTENKLVLVGLHNRSKTSPVKPPPYSSYAVKVLRLPLHLYIEVFRSMYGVPDFVSSIPAKDAFDLIVDESIRLGAQDITITDKRGVIEVYYNINKRLVDSRLSQIIDGKSFKDIINLIQTKAKTAQPSAGTRKVVLSGIKLEDEHMARVTNNYNYWGNMLSIRIHPTTMQHIALDKLNLPKEFIDFAGRSLLTRRGGLNIVAGETMSGKNTTVIALLTLIYNTVRSKIVSIEMPVEILTDFIEHIEVSDVEELTDVVDSIVRNNPDIIYIGEMREEAIAKATLASSNHGKPVYSTLHANSPAEVPSRLMDLTGLSIERVLFTINTITHQTLLPRICPKCGDEGCPDCYKAGMIPWVQFIEVSEELRRKILGLSLSEVYRVLQASTVGRDNLERLFNAGQISQKTFDWRFVK